MKKKYLFAEFCIVFFFLLLPPLFFTQAHSATESAGTVAHFLQNALSQFFIALCIHIQCTRLFLPHLEQSALPKKTQQIKRLIVYLKWGSITFGLLMLTYATFEALSLIVTIPTPSTTIVPPFSSLKAIIPFGIHLFCAAYYEEVLYRFFVPEVLCTLFPAKKPFMVCAELFSLIIFALAHRYLGILGVLNALICGCILRLCFKRSSGILLGTGVHFAYNITILLFMSLS